MLNGKNKPNSKKFYCWISDEYKLLSFHFIEGYEQIEFDTLEEFQEYYYRKTYWGYKVL